MLRPNPPLYPTGGWFYRHTDGTVLADPNKSGLIVKVTEYFVRVGEDPTKAEDRIDEFICKVRPSICLDETIVMRTRETTPGMALAAKMMGYLNLTTRVNRLTPGGIPRVAKEIAARRAEICRACPQNQQWSRTCSACEENVSHAVKNFAKLGPDVDTNGLKGCQHFGYSLPVAVRVAFKEFDPGAPEKCWRLPS